ARASSTTARSSSIEYWVESIRSVGEATPPDSITLTWWAPRRSCSLAALRTSRTPSATTVRVGQQGRWASTAPPGPRAGQAPPGGGGGHPGVGPGQVAHAGEPPVQHPP